MVTTDKTLLSTADSTKPGGRAARVLDGFRETLGSAVHAAKARAIALKVAAVGVVLAAAVALVPAPAQAYSYGYSYNLGRVGGPHAWIVMTDAELAQASFRAAAQAACARALGIKFSGQVCGPAVDAMYAAIDWRRWNNHGVFIEIRWDGRRTYLGRW